MKLLCVIVLVQSKRGHSRRSCGIKLKVNPSVIDCMQQEALNLIQIEANGLHSISSNRWGQWRQTIKETSILILVATNVQMFLPPSQTSMTAFTSPKLILSLLILSWLFLLTSDELACRCRCFTPLLSPFRRSDPYDSVTGRHYVWADRRSGIHRPPHGRHHDQQMGGRRLWTRGNLRGDISWFSMNYSACSYPAYSSRLLHFVGTHPTERVPLPGA